MNKRRTGLTHKTLVEYGPAGWQRRRHDIRRKRKRRIRNHLLTSPRTDMGRVVRLSRRGIDSLHILCTQVHLLSDVQPR